MKNIATFFFVGATVLLLGLSSCNKWLDAPTPLQVDNNKLFSTEQGFKDVLQGVYLTMNTRGLYGRELTLGLNSILGRSYDTEISPDLDPLFYQGAQYDFAGNAVKAASKVIWDSMYVCIANINNLLANMDSHKPLFTGNNFNLVQGEALGLRAFLHFELLRMFAPAPGADGKGLSAPAIPYYTKLSPVAAPVLTTGDVLDACIKDIELALPQLQDQSLETSHFNFYAAKGLLARLYLYKGDVASARKEAMDIISSGQFPLATNNKDLMFTEEHLFSLYSYSNDALKFNKSVLNGATPLGFSKESQTALFVSGSGSTRDWRRAFVDPQTGVAFGNTISPKKYYGTTANVLPLIRVTEMYYIAAEGATGAGDTTDATSLLDSVRVHRNLPEYTTNLSADSLNVEIYKEYQKEFLGEGQLFFYFKRKNIPFQDLPYTAVPVVPNTGYVFIKPE